MSAAARVRLSAELVSRERALRDLKMAREREAQSYSVVPYRGKHGESRQPLYIECTRTGLVFHPDRKELLLASPPGEVKGEMRKVAWPTKKEVINSTIIVLIAVIVMATLIFGFDYVSSKFVLFLLD